MFKREFQSYCLPLLILRLYTFSFSFTFHFELAFTSRDGARGFIWISIRSNKVEIELFRVVKEIF